MELKEVKAERRFELTLSEDELFAIWKLIGASSITSMEALGLTKEAAQTLDELYTGLCKNKTLHEEYLDRFWPGLLGLMGKR